MQIKRVVPIVFLFLSLVACDILNPPEPGNDRPTVTSTNPSDGDQNVSVDANISVQLNLVNGSAIDSTQLGNGTLRLKEAGTEALLSGTATASGGTITFDPGISLKENTSYTFEITDGVKDESGNAVEPKTITFATGTLNVDPTVPRITRVRPADGATNVALGTGIGTDLKLPNGGVDEKTFTDTTIKLTNTNTGQAVPARRSTTGGNDAITLQPTQPLESNTTYRFEVTSGVKDLQGEPFLPFSSTFTTGSGSGSNSGVNFAKTVVTSPNDSNQYSTLAIGPDRKLYASTIDGRIVRFPIQSDGTLGSAETITSLQEAEGGPTLLIGLTFDPSATVNNLIVWVSHTTFGFDGVDVPFGGKITRLSGPNLENVQDYVKNLPRSFKDHVTNSIAFKPGDPNALYFNQGSNTAMGAPDIAWGGKSETLLSAATLRLDINEVTSPPLDVQTGTSNAYDPFAAGAPLTIYGRGIRNAYDLVWHSNGNLYVPVNGSAGGGVVPRYDLNEVGPGGCSTRPDGRYSGPILDEPDDVSTSLYVTKDGDPDKVTPIDTDGWKNDQTQNDYLFKVEEDGYYGHPNPKRCEWILNGGGNYQDSDTRISIYKSSTNADPNYRGVAYNFEKNKSPNGVIEYKSDAFGGALKGKLLVTRYSLRDDVIALTLGSEGNVVSEEVPSGLTGFVDPLDLIEDTLNGNIYVSEFDEGGDETKDDGPQITLLRPAN